MRMREGKEQKRVALLRWVFNWPCSLLDGFLWDFIVQPTIKSQCWNRGIRNHCPSNISTNDSFDRLCQPIDHIVLCGSVGYEIQEPPLVSNDLTSWVGTNWYKSTDKGMLSIQLRSHISPGPEPRRIKSEIRTQMTCGTMSRVRIWWRLAINTLRVVPPEATSSRY